MLKLVALETETNGQNKKILSAGKPLYGGQSVAECMDGWKNS